MAKKILIFLLTVLLALAIWQWKLISYGIQQGLGQFMIVRNSVPISDLLSSSDFPDSLKLKIDLIQQAKEFSTEVLGLHKSENYSTYYDEGDEVTLWNVSACAEFSLTPKRWWFPVVGSVPYKGFFDKDKAINLVKKLKAEGWDARMRPVGGWSTLGWFSDPILSSMLQRSDGQLAELIIHELTHGTLFVSDQIQFNENLASFIGEKGAVLFLKTNYGEDSQELVDYQNSESDSQKFRKHMLLGTAKLDSLYQTFDSSMDDSTKIELKNSFIRRITSSLDSIHFFNPRYKWLFDDSQPNNAYFMSYLRYHSSADSLEHMLNVHNGNLKLFIEANIRHHGK